MTVKKRNAGNLKLLGGRLCLDFVNTLDWRGTDFPKEYLTTFYDLAIWCRHVGICTHQEFTQLSLMADCLQLDALKVQRRAVKLRETIYRIFSVIIENRDPTKKDLKILNINLSRSMKALQITKTKEGFTWDTTGDKTKLDWILNPIIRSAADLLFSDVLKNVKACSDSACGWLFLDVSRNRSRRWCDMNDCGNRSKASRFYKKKRKSSANRGERRDFINGKNFS